MSDPTIAAIRRHMAAMGHDLSHLTDDEIVAGVAKAGDLIASTGVSAAEAGGNLTATFAAIRRASAERFGDSTEGDSE